MKETKRQKGVVLLIVIGVSLAVFIGLLGFLIVLRANTRNLESFKERAKAFYLCESAASIAILDISVFNVTSIIPPGGVFRSDVDRSSPLNYTIDYHNATQTYTEAYPLHYSITRGAEQGNATGVYTIKAWVDRDAGFSRKYTLTVTGRRAFPIFIRGFPGK